MIDVLVSVRRDIAAARRFFVRMLAVQADPEEITTDRAPALAAVIAELLPAAVHDTERYANNRWNVTMADSRLACGRCAA